MEPVIADLVFVADKAEGGHLGRDPLPVPLRCGKEIICSAKSVQRRPVEERLVEVIYAIAAVHAPVVAEAPVRFAESLLEPTPTEIEEA